MVQAGGHCPLDQTGHSGASITSGRRVTPDALLFLQVHRYRVTRVAIETKCDSFLATAEAHRIDFIRDDLQEDTVQQFEAVDPLRPRNFERRESN